MTSARPGVNSRVMPCRTSSPTQDEVQRLSKLDEDLILLKTKPVRQIERELGVAFPKFESMTFVASEQALIASGATPVSPDGSPLV